MRELVRPLSRRTARTVLAVLVVAVIAVGAPSTARLLRAGEPLTAQAERLDPQSPLARRLRSLPRSALVFTTRPELFYGLTGRPSLLVPLREFPESATTNEDYATEVCEMGDYLARRGGVLVLFPTLLRAVPTASELGTQLELQPSGGATNATVFTVSRSCR
jgi:hypothetical protein